MRYSWLTKQVGLYTYDNSHLEQKGANSSTDQCKDHYSKDETAGADFGAQLASPGPKADLASPTTVGECASQEPALAPSRDAVPGFTKECTDG